MSACEDGDVGRMESGQEQRSELDSEMELVKGV